MQARNTSQPFAHFGHHVPEHFGIPLTGQKLNYWDEHRPNMHANLKEAWYSTDSNTINRHIDIPTIYLPLKTLHRSSTNIDVNMTNANNVDVPIALMSTSTTQHSNHSNNNTPNNKVQSTITTHPSTTNNIRSTSKQPIRRSQRIRSQQRET